MFLADVAEEDAEPEEGSVTDMNFFYIRQFQVHLYSNLFKANSTHLFASYFSALIQIGCLGLIISQTSLAEAT